MKLVIVSGVSGSGKSVALHTLEDGGYYCVDNLPLSLLPSLLQELTEAADRGITHAAVGIDARCGVEQLANLAQIVAQVKAMQVDVTQLFLYAEVDTLLKRFSETRRKHPLSRSGMPLVEAITAERQLLQPLLDNADLRLDTTLTSLHQLRSLLRERLIMPAGEGLSILLQSFGFKHGVPSDTDFVFDVRCLPNPHWDPNLRPLTGRDPAVAEFLQQHDSVHTMQEQIRAFLLDWLPQFEAENRSYLTVSIGCTGGQHRSVFMVERLATRLGTRFPNISIRHRELPHEHRAIAGHA